MEHYIAMHEDSCDFVHRGQLRLEGIRQLDQDENWHETFNTADSGLTVDPNIDITIGSIGQSEGLTRIGHVSRGSDFRPIEFAGLTTLDRFHVATS
jgi:hypothetical protein